MVASAAFSTFSLMPHRVHTGSRSPVTPSSGYAAIAAWLCPGTSTSGTTVTCRAAAYATISRRSSPE